MDTERVSMDAIVRDLAIADTPGKILASFCAEFLAGITEVSLTEQDLQWYNDGRNRSSIEGVFRDYLVDDETIQIQWISEAPNRPPMLQDGTAFWTIRASDEMH